MSAKSSAERLIQELLDDPSKFDDKGRAYELLQEYFNGYPIETLRPLIQNSDRMVQRSAIWVASELGIEASDLIHDVIPLIYKGDRFIKYHALEIVIVCAVGENIEEFIHIVRALLNEDEVLRVLAMDLVGNADESQLKVATRLLDEADPDDRLHMQGLSKLLDRDNLGANDIVSMMSSEESLTRKYGAIAARRIYQKTPELIVNAASSSDPDVRKFAERTVRVLDL